LRDSSVPRWLTIVSRPARPMAGSPADPRSLGLPLFALRAE
jgi:hypothetical protein